MNKSLSFTSLAVALLASLAFVPGNAVAAAKSCRPGTSLWTVNKKPVCLKTAKASAGHPAAETRARIAAAFDAATKLPKSMQKKLPRGLRKVSPKGRALALKLYDGHSAGLSAPKRNSLGLKGHGVAAASSGNVIATLEDTTPVIHLPDGAELSVHFQVRAFEDGTRDYNYEYVTKQDGYTVKIRPHVYTESSLLPEVRCPTADGILTIDFTQRSGATLTAFKGSRVIAAATNKQTSVLHATGHVGRDARLHDVQSEVSMKYEDYSRGSQFVFGTKGSFTIPRDGDPIADGPISVDVSAKVAGASRAEERAAEQQTAATLAASKGAADKLASFAELGRWRMKQDEQYWYTVNYCASAVFSPSEDVRLPAGKSLSVDGSVTSIKYGGDSPGDFTVTAAETGSFVATKAATDPGSHAKFTATGAGPTADGTTVAAQTIATSKAGRAEWGWTAKDDIALPQKLSGVISATATIPGADYSYFHSWAEYTLDQVYSDPSGYISAFYKLTSADQDEVQHDIGAGCRYVAKGSGGTIADGDIEFRKAPGGQWQHAVMYDVEIENATYSPTDCGSTPIEPFSGALVGFVNMAVLGGGFEPVGDNFHLEAIRNYTDPASGRHTVADWNLDPDEG